MTTADTIRTQSPEPFCQTGSGFLFHVATGLPVTDALSKVAEFIDQAMTNTRQHARQYGDDYGLMTQTEMLLDMSSALLQSVSHAMHALHRE